MQCTSGISRSLVLSAAALLLLAAMISSVRGDDLAEGLKPACVAVSFEVHAGIGALFDAYDTCQSLWNRGMHPIPQATRLQVIAVSGDGSVKALDYSALQVGNAIAWAYAKHDVMRPRVVEGYFKATPWSYATLENPPRELGHYGRQGEVGKYPWQVFSKRNIAIACIPKSVLPLHLTFFIPAQALGPWADGLPRIDASSYCTTTVPGAGQAYEFMRNLEKVRESGDIAISSQSFGQTLAGRESEEDKPGEQQTALGLPFLSAGAPVVWLVTENKDGKQALLTGLANMFERCSANRDWPLSMAGIDTRRESPAIPDAQLFGTFETTLLPDLTHRPLDRNSLIAELQGWDTIHVGVYALSKGGLQLFFFRGSAD